MRIFVASSGVTVPLLMMSACGAVLPVLLILFSRKQNTAMDSLRTGGCAMALNGDVVLRGNVFSCN